MKLAMVGAMMPIVTVIVKVDVAMVIDDAFAVKYAMDYPWRLGTLVR